MSGGCISLVGAAREKGCGIFFVCVIDVMASSRLAFVFSVNSEERLCCRKHSLTTLRQCEQLKNPFFPYFTTSAHRPETKWPIITFQRRHNLRKFVAIKNCYSPRTNEYKWRMKMNAMAREPKKERRKSGYIRRVTQLHYKNTLERNSKNARERVREKWRKKFTKIRIINSFSGCNFVLLFYLKMNDKLCAV